MLGSEPDIWHQIFYYAGACAVCNLLFAALSKEDGSTDAIIEGLQSISDEILFQDKEFDLSLDIERFIPKSRKQEIN